MHSLKSIGGEKNGMYHGETGRAFSVELLFERKNTLCNASLNVVLSDNEK